MKGNDKRVVTGFAGLLFVLLLMVSGCHGSAQGQAAAPVASEPVETYALNVSKVVSNDDIIQLIYAQRYEEAVALATQRMEQNGVTAELLELRGIAYIKENKRFPANEDLVAAVKMEASVDHLYNLGLALRQGGFCQRAVAAFSNALNMAPNDYQIMANLGSSYVCFGKTDEGIAILEKALQLNPADDVSMANLGIAYLEKEDYANAELYLKRAIQTNDNNAPAHFALYKMYSIQHKEKELDYHRLRFTELRPKSRHRKTM